jgi:hypothetical protein
MLYQDFELSRERAVDMRTEVDCKGMCLDDKLKWMIEGMR